MHSQEHPLLNGCTSEKAIEGRHHSSHRTKDYACALNRSVPWREESTPLPAEALLALSEQSRLSVTRTVISAHPLEGLLGWH